MLSASLNKTFLSFSLLLLPLDIDPCCVLFCQLGAVNNISLVNAMKFVENPRKMCERVHDMIREITTKIRALKLELKKKGNALQRSKSKFESDIFNIVVFGCVVCSVCVCICSVCVYV